MKVHLIEGLIGEFISYQLEKSSDAWILPHSLVDHFNAHWRLTDEGSLRSMMEECLKSEISNRWSKRDGYRPRDIVLQLIDADPELALIAFKDLSNDQATLDGRLSRFDYYCSELLQIHRQKNYKSVESYHHQDASMISLYLAGMFPEKYTLYPGLKIFTAFCQKIGSPDIPVVNDLVRFMKVASIVNTFFQKNPNGAQLIYKRQELLPTRNLFPFQMVFEIISHGGGNPQLDI
jgi:hypothetical protein